MANVLIVDDDDFVRTVMIQALKSAGYDVDECSNGSDAIEKLKNKSYDIVVTDIVMPGESGINVGEYVRGHNLPVSVIAVSAHGGDAGMLDFANYFADETLQKPFQKEEFLKVVESVSKGVNVESALQNM